MAGTRELVVDKTPFIVVYRLRDDVAEILRVLHGRLDWLHDHALAIPGVVASSMC